MNDSSSAVAVVEVSGATSIAVGESQACATLSNGSVSCWGTNGEGELGDGTGVDSPTPVKVAGLTNAVALAGGWDHTCALLADATVQCWGDNDFGQLGTSATGPDTCPSGTTCSKVPVPVSGLMGATRVVAGQNFTCALQSGGSVACWGANVDGELGGGTDMGPQLCAGEPCSPTPITIGQLVAISIACGGNHCCALSSAGSIACWGDNNDGQLGNGSPFGPEECAGDPCSTSPVAVQW
jgi:alpha-tubulin suppressor-like RCC1 family protein